MGIEFARRYARNTSKYFGVFSIFYFFNISFGFFIFQLSWDKLKLKYMLAHGRLSLGVGAFIDEFGLPDRITMNPVTRDVTGFYKEIKLKKCVIKNVKIITNKDHIVRCEIQKKEFNF